LSQQNAQTTADFISIPDAEARRLGVLGGCVPREPSRVIAQWQATEELVSPLVLGGSFEIFDFTRGYDANRKLNHRYGIGRYDEDRRGMYEADLFKASTSAGHESARTIHMGIDLGAAAGTPIFSPCRAEVWGSAFLDQEGDYGGTILLKINDLRANDLSLYMLFGHLSRASTLRFQKGVEVGRGELLGWLGEKHENGGWNPHLHWQLSWLEPVAVDLPGAVSTRTHELARAVFPDPTTILKSSLAGWR
jgi:murein DD-endopeptidase MepM/ murein hydrolase activator NlpD